MASLSFSTSRPTRPLSQQQHSNLPTNLLPGTYRWPWNVVHHGWLRLSILFCFSIIHILGFTWLSQPQDFKRLVYLFSSVSLPSQNNSGIYCYIPCTAWWFESRLCHSSTRELDHSRTQSDPWWWGYIALVAYSYSYFLHVYVIFFFPLFAPIIFFFFFLWKFDPLDRPLFF